jgi:hypothetical protein
VYRIENSPFLCLFVGWNINPSIHQSTFYSLVRFGSDWFVFVQVDLQLPPTAFNFRKPPQGLADNNDVVSHLPCRILYDWYLTKQLTYENTSFHDRRVPLPTDRQELDDYILMGTLKPHHALQTPIKVQLHELQFYIIDHTRGFRGYWVITPFAKYWLQQPCQKTLNIPRFTVRVGGGKDGGKSCLEKIELPCQEQLHFFHRAQLGLLSNMIDLFLPDDSYNYSLQSLSPEQIDGLLTPTYEVWEFQTQQCDAPPLYKHAFDLGLLLSSNFLHGHIQCIHPEIAKSRFCIALLKSEVGAQNCTLQTRGQEEEWIESAKKSEHRSQQLPWGEKLATDASQPNLMYPFELELEYRLSIAKLKLADTDDDSASSASSLVRQVGSLVSNVETATPLLIDTVDCDSDSPSKGGALPSKRGMPKNEKEDSNDDRVPETKRKKPKLSRSLVFEKDENKIDKETEDAKCIKETSSTAQSDNVKPLQSKAIYADSEKQDATKRSPSPSNAIPPDELTVLNSWKVSIPRKMNHSGIAGAAKAPVPDWTKTKVLGTTPSNTSAPVVLSKLTQGGVTIPEGQSINTASKSDRDMTTNYDRHNCGDEAPQGPSARTLLVETRQKRPFPEDSSQYRVAGSFMKRGSRTQERNLGSLPNQSFEKQFDKRRSSLPYSSSIDVNQMDARSNASDRSASQSLDFNPRRDTTRLDKRTYNDRCTAHRDYHYNGRQVPRSHETRTVSSSSHDALYGQPYMHHDAENERHRSSSHSRDCGSARQGGVADSRGGHLEPTRSDTQYSGSHLMQSIDHWDRDGTYTQREASRFWNTDNFDGRTQHECSGSQRLSSHIESIQWSTEKIHYDYISFDSRRYPRDRRPPEGGHVGDRDFRQGESAPGKHFHRSGKAAEGDSFDLRHQMLNKQETHSAWHRKDVLMEEVRKSNESSSYQQSDSGQPLYERASEAYATRGNGIHEIKELYESAGHATNSEYKGGWHNPHREYRLQVASSHDSEYMRSNHYRKESRILDGEQHGHHPQTPESWRNWQDNRPTLNVASRSNFDVEDRRFDVGSRSLFRSRESLRNEGGCESTRDYCDAIMKFNTGARRCSELENRPRSQYDTRDFRGREGGRLDARY